MGSCLGGIMPLWLLPCCLGRSPSFSFHPFSLWLFVYPSSWPVSHSNVLPDPSCWCLQMTGVMSHGGRGRAARTGGIQGCDGCAASGLYYIHSNTCNYKEDGTSSCLGIGSLNLQFWVWTNYSIKLSSSVCWLVGRWWGQIARGGAVRKGQMLELRSAQYFVGYGSLKMMAEDQRLVLCFPNGSIQTDATHGEFAVSPGGNILVASTFFEETGAILSTQLYFKD